VSGIKPAVEFTAKIISTGDQMITGYVALGVAWADRLNSALDTAGYSGHSCPKFRNRTLSRYLAYQPPHLTRVPTPGRPAI
jgi:hypothetical protein